MVNSSINKKFSNICFQCGSELIFVSRETTKLEGMRYAQTNTVYRCSNVACQNKKDKDKTDRLKLKQNQVATQKERMEKIQEKRRLGKKLKMQQT
jgi:hypothetical protein